VVVGGWGAWNVEGGGRLGFSPTPFLQKAKKGSEVKGTTRRGGKDWVMEVQPLGAQSSSTGSPKKSRRFDRRKKQVKRGELLGRVGTLAAK